MAEWRGGLSPPRSHRTVRDCLQSHGSWHPSKAAAFRHDRSAPPVAGWPSRSWRGCPGPFAPRALLRFIATTSQSAPARRIGTFGLTGPPLAPFPFAPPNRFSSSIPEPEPESRHLYPGHRIASSQVSAMLFPGVTERPGFGAIYGVFSRRQPVVHLRSSLWFAHDVFITPFP